MISLGVPGSSIGCLESVWEMLSVKRAVLAGCCHDSGRKTWEIGDAVRDHEPLLETTDGRDVDIKSIYDFAYAVSRGRSGAFRELFDLAGTVNHRKTT